MLLPGILSELLAADNRRGSAAASADPLAAKEPHFTPKARRVIFLFSTGGVSHMDTFDHKPTLFRADGRMIVNPSADIILSPGDTLIALGKRSDLDRVDEKSRQDR